MSSSSIGDGTASIYELDWANGPTVRTDELPDIPEVETDDDKTHICDISRAEVIEMIAELGMDDEDCNAQLVGFE